MPVGAGSMRRLAHGPQIALALAVLIACATIGLCLASAVLSGRLGGRGLYADHSAVDEAAPRAGPVLPPTGEAGVGEGAVEAAGLRGPERQSPAVRGLHGPLHHFVVPLPRARLRRVQGEELGRGDPIGELIEQTGGAW
jgi:hypothetical protein